MKLLAIAAGMALVFTSLGCASPWQQFYAPVLGTNAIQFPPTDSVSIRTVEYERMQKYVEKEKQWLASNNKAIEQFTKAERWEVKNRLLEAVRLPERNDAIAMLGFSEFVIGQPQNVNDPRLEAFAKQIGADYAVVTGTFVGQSNKVVSVPVTDYSQSQSTAYIYGSRGYVGSANIYSSGTTTGWVPMTVAQNQYVYTCMFFRKMRPGESDALLKRAGLK